MLKLPQSMIAPLVLWVIVIWLPAVPMLAVPFTTAPLSGKFCANAGAAIGIAIAPTSASANRCRRTVRSRLEVCLLRMIVLLRTLSGSTRTNGGCGRRHR